MRNAQQQGSVIEYLRVPYREYYGTVPSDVCVAHVDVSHLQPDGAVHDPVHDRLGVNPAAQPGVPVLQPVFAETGPELVRAGCARAVELLAAENRDTADLLEEAAPFVLTYLDFSREHRNWIRTDNVQECVNAEIERRIKAVSVFPSVEPLVRLVGAVLLDQNDAWLYAQNFIDARSLRKGYELPGLPAAGEGGVERVPMIVEVAFLDKLGKVT